VATINQDLIGKAEVIDSPQRVVLDMDSTEIPVYRQQEGSAYNGHFESTEKFREKMKSYAELWFTGSREILVVA
jgi:hypothetical protein